MPAFLDFHSMGRYNDDDLKKSLKEPRNELEVKVLNTFYDLDSGMMFCLVDAPDRYAVEKASFKVWDEMRLDYSHQDDLRV